MGKSRKKSLQLSLRPTKLKASEMTAQMGSILQACCTDTARYTMKQAMTRSPLILSTQSISLFTVQMEAFRHAWLECDREGPPLSRNKHSIAQTTMYSYLSKSGIIPTRQADPRYSRKQQTSSAGAIEVTYRFTSDLGRLIRSNSFPKGHYNSPIPLRFPSSN